MTGAWITSLVVALHLGGLHPVEKWLALVLAFGPFVVLGLVIWWRQRHPEDEDEASVDTRD